MIFGHFLFAFYLHRSFGKLHPFFTVRFSGFSRPTERMCQLITQPQPPGRPNRTMSFSDVHFSIIYEITMPFKLQQLPYSADQRTVKSFSHSQAWIFTLILLLKLIAGGFELEIYNDLLKKEKFFYSVHNDGFCDGCISKRCLHKLKKVSYNDLISLLLYDKR